MSIRHGFHVNKKLLETFALKGESELASRTICPNVSRIMRFLAFAMCSQAQKKGAALKASLHAFAVGAFRQTAI